MQRKTAAQRRTAVTERKKRVFPRIDRPYGLKRAAFQTEIALGSELITNCFFCGRTCKKINITSYYKNVHLYLPVWYVRVLGRMGEFEGELRERLSSLHYGKAGPFWLRAKGVPFPPTSCGPSSGLTGRAGERGPAAGAGRREPEGQGPRRSRAPARPDPDIARPYSR